ncbi:hypothetical protein [Cumulibacter soli]|uniref:hypothetical protein n=1 Tax=Cumulibacter soli TaxID=2546344 RepID=UPI001068279F|nr:hypothetical protein [Cumulibacter soli]
MNRYVRIVLAIVVLVFGALTTGSGIFGAASNSDSALFGLLVALFGGLAVGAGIWIGVGGSDDRDSFSRPNVRGRMGYLLVACLTGVLALISLAYFFTGIGDSTRPQQDGDFGFMPIGLAGMVLFGSASVLCLVAWLGARRR